MPLPEPIYVGQWLYIRPNYVISMPEWSFAKTYDSHARKKNEANLKDNKHRGKVSEKAMKEIKNSVNWLIHAAKFKTIWHAESKKNYSFKVNFITLTLPDTNKEVSDKCFKEDLLEPLLATLRKGYGLKNYVWKLELQENGKLHAHLTTDTFIYWKDLRRLWNKRLASVGIIKAYKEKFSNCSFEQYLMHLSRNDKRTLNEKRLSWERSTAENWSNPNSTDVHAVYKVKDIAAYISKYMAKDADKLEKVKGRIWGCNYQISRGRKPKVFIDRTSEGLSIRSLMQKDIRWKGITVQKDLSKPPRKIGEMYFLNQTQWRVLIKGSLRQEYERTIKILRQTHSIFESDPIVVSPASVVSSSVVVNS